MKKIKNLKVKQLKKMFPFTWEFVIENMLPEEILEEAGIELVHPNEVFVQHDWCEDYYGSNYGRVISLKWGRVEVLPALPMGKPNKKGEVYLGYKFSKPGSDPLPITCQRVIADCFLPNFWKGVDRNKLQAHHLDHGCYNNIWTNIMLLPTPLHRVMDYVKKTALFADGEFKEMNLYEIMIETGLSLDEMILATKNKPERSIGGKWTIFEVRGNYIGFQFLPGNQKKGAKKKKKAK